MSKWPTKPLGEVASVIRGVSFDKSQVFDSPDLDLVPILRAGNIQDSLNVETDLVYVPSGLVSAEQRMRRGDLAICMSSGSAAIVGKTAHLDRDWTGAVGAFCAVIRFDPQIHHRFGSYWFRSSAFTAWRDGNAKGANIQNLRRAELERLEIPVPPLAEQERIVKLLDEADALRKLRAEADRRTAELIPALFYEMFGDPVRNEKGWEVATLGDVCEKLTDGSHFSPPQVTKGVPYVTAKHLRAHGLDFGSAPSYISKEHHDAIYSRCDPQHGDVLYIKDGATTGLAAVNRYDFEFSMLSSLALMRPNSNICDSEFLCAWLNNSSVKRQMVGDMSGAAIRRLTLVKLRRAHILIPPIDIQKTFTNRVRATNEFGSAQSTIRNQLDDVLFGALRVSLAHEFG